MVQALPRVIPINELKNTAKISALCRESDVPIVVTRNGYGEMVLMSVALYERTMAELRAAPTGGSQDRVAFGGPTAPEGGIGSTDRPSVRAASAPAEEGFAPRQSRSVRAVADEPADDEFALLGAIYGD